MRYHWQSLSASASGVEGGSVPTYQYACTECGEQSEAIQKFTDDPLTVCTACGGRLRKVFSPVGIVFKGSGFYRTDSRASSNGQKQKNGSRGAAETSANSKPADSKPGDSGGTAKSGDSASAGAKSGDGASGNGKSASSSSSAAKVA
jgi:putative FmdB family regulatory protein